MTPRIFVECLYGIAVLSSVSCGVCLFFCVVGEESDYGATFSWCHF